jgi:hypothetical protein
MDHAVMEGPALLVWLETGWIGAAMRKSPMLYPAVETLHIIGFAVLIGSIIAFDLRVLGFGRFLPIERAARHLLPVALGGFALAVPMGILLFSTEATSIAGNPAFLMKMSLIVVAGVNALLFHLIPWRRVAVWGEHDAPPTARLGAVMSIVVWIGVVCGGRLIAYF